MAGVNISRMRTIDGTFKLIKRSDPKTSITKHYLRQLVISGEIPSKKAGKKYLVDLNEVERFFSCSLNGDG